MRAPTGLAAGVAGLWRKLSAVATGAALAQALGVLLLPVVARYVSPAEMGHYARAVAIGMAVSVVLTLRLEAAVFSASTAGRQLQTAAAAVAVASILTLAAVLVLAMPRVGAAFAGMLDLRSPADLMLIVLVGFALALNTTLTNAAAAVKAYRSLAVSKPLKQVLEFGVLIALSVLTIGSLMLPWASVIACTAAAAVAGVGIYRSLPAGRRWRCRPRSAGIRAAIRRYRKFAIADLPAAFAVQAGLAVPLVLFTDRFGLVAGGLFVLAQRVANAPVVLAGSTIGLVFRAELKRHAHPQRFFAQAMLILVAAGVVIYGSIAALPAGVLAWLLGEEWAGTAPYLGPMALYGFVRLVAIPLSYALYVTEAVQMNALMQGAHLAAIVLLFTVFDGARTPVELLYAFVALEVGFYALYVGVSFHEVTRMRVPVPA